MSHPPAQLVTAPMVVLGLFVLPAVAFGLIAVAELRAALQR